MHTSTRPEGRAFRASLWLAAGLWLGACTTPAPEPPPASPLSPAEPAAEPLPPAQPAAAVSVEPAPAAPASPSQAQQAQRLALSAIERLELGNEELALPEIERALRIDPANRLAQSLLRQAQTDPQTLLGHESFSYRLQAGDSLSRVAGRFLGDVHLFYALARYNEIKVPRHVQEGQWIRVPGKAPPPAPAANAPLTAAEGQAPLTVIPAAMIPTPAGAASTVPGNGAAASPSPVSPSAAASAPAASGQMVTVANSALAAQHYRRGLALLARQKPAEAIEAFDAALERDPQHANAKLRRAQAVNQVNGLIRLLENSIRQLDGRIAQEPDNASLKAQRDKLALEREHLLTVK